VKKRLANIVPSLRVGILVTPQFTLNALANFVDALRLASDEGDASGAIHCSYHLMSATGRPERASCGYLLTPTASLIEPSRLDYIAIVGGLLYRGRTLDPTTCAYLKQAAAAGTPLIGICTGSFVLCRLGLMRDRKVSVSWFHQRDFAEEFPNMEPIADALYVIDLDRLTTSGGVGAALAAAALVERHIGRDMAQKSLRIMQIAPTVHLQPPPPSIPNQADELVCRALLIMEQNISHSLSIEDIASRLRVSRRSLERHFKRYGNDSPKESYLALRLRHAQLLRQMGQSLQQIATETGFAGSSHLSTAFRKRFGHSLGMTAPARS
jgi:transcriptional regulator GlxA family with amidase domain